MSKRRPPPTAFAELAAAMAHEVRNPLSAMAIHLELIESRAKKCGGEGEAIVRSLAVVQREVSRIDRILVEYLRHVGPRENKRSPIAASEVLAAAIDRAATAAGERGVTIETEVGRGAAAWPIDAASIGQLLDVLIANALEASPHGGSIALRVLGDEESAIVEVSDRGEGIAPDRMPRIFELGFSTKKGHAGLGLAVAKQIAKGHGGSLSAQSEGAGRGATFRVELPIDAD